MSTKPSDQRRNRSRAALAGVLAVGLALGISELAAALFDGVPSLVLAVGSVLIPIIPAALEDFAIRTFGTSDKVVLNISTLAGTLAFGAWAGIRGWESIRAAARIWIGFTLVGLVAALMQPLVAVPTTLVAIAISSALGYGALLLLRNADLLVQRLLTAKDNGVEIGNRSADAIAELARRRFLGLLAGVGGAGLLAAYGGRSLLGPRIKVDFDAIALPLPIRSASAVDAVNAFAVDGITPILVPNSQFYRIDTALAVPRIDPENWTLRIFGMVDEELEFSYQDILAMDMVEAYITLSCVSNQVGGDLVGNAKWLGVPLGKILDMAGVQSGADQIVGRSVDGWDAGFPTPMAYDRDTLLAVGMNDEVLPARSGFPARLVVPGLYGYVSATKWLREIELTTWDAFDGYWVPRGWDKEGPIKAQSRIDVPRSSATVPVGPTVFAGVAYAPHVGIARVEVRIDDGSWTETQLSSPLSDDAWVQWRVELALPGGTHLVEVRATDANGVTQGADYVPPRPNGAEGHDVIRITAA